MTDQVACRLDELEPGSALQAELTLPDGSDTPVAIVRTEDGDVYAIGDVCTHGEVSLSEGDVEGCEIECWAHGGRFDVRTGQATELPAFKAVPAYPTRIEDGNVLVDIDSPLTAAAS